MEMTAAGDLFDKHWLYVSYSMTAVAYVHASMSRPAVTERSACVCWRSVKSYTGLLECEASACAHYCLCVCAEHGCVCSWCDCVPFGVLGLELACQSQ